MKRSLLIGAALVFSLSAVACSDDDDSPVSTGDGGHIVTDGGLDGSVHLDSSVPDAAAGDAGETDSGL